MQIDSLLSESGLRLAVFIGLLTLFSLWEVFGARRQVARPWRVRVYNLALLAVGTGVLRIAAIAVQFGSAAGAALWAKSAQFGAFYWLDAPLWVSIPLGLLALDFMIFGQHWVFHKVPLFWRFHRVHHTDREVDATTALRFHPGEMLISMILKVALIALLGIPLAAAISFELILNGMAMFNHANIRIPARLEPVLRFFVVTPDMHRVHHSVESTEHNRNFGFNLSVWDRVCRTYQAQPDKGHEDMPLGLPGFRGADLGLGRMLGLPFEWGNKSGADKVKAE